MITKFSAQDKYKCWARVITRVDTSKSTGYAFEGPFIKCNQLVEVGEGSVVVVFEDTGSRNRRCYEAHVYVIEEPEPREVFSAEGPDWALKIRDTVAELLGESRPASGPLATVSDAELLAEVNRRGLTT